MSEHRPLRSYGRTKARTLKPRQAGLVETLLPHLALDLSKEIDVRLPAPLRGGAGGGGSGGDLSGEPAARTPISDSAPQGGGESLDASPLVLEIGFGGGEHLVAQAAAQPHAHFIGVEPFLNGVASCLRHIEESGVTNVRLHHGDARDVLARLPDASLDRVDILFPDPWPKKRHWKRRLIQPEFVSELARAVKPGGEVHFATDWANYAAWTLEVFARAPYFAWTAERAADWRTPWPGHVTTRYEQKRLGDCAPVWLRFARLA
ncbi:tRNA (guanosine(46)-N7)-methyltransferase TrmB [Terricaulis sp.]|uniref:tRNA (guanosine(46)-N7)-methyltransferase TrmB n=1 Tax=Terricaulis sp. TaxID=2768686 RepID=UPI003784D353